VAFAEDEETLAADRAWARELWQALRPHAGRDTVYVNFDAELDDARVRATYGAKYRRLAALKAEWDPDNVFHHNANIPPPGGSGAPVPAPREAAAQPARPAT
jgi:FAD/FMN-containing dehydrogenase